MGFRAAPGGCGWPGFARRDEEEDPRENGWRASPVGWLAGSLNSPLKDLRRDLGIRDWGEGFTVQGFRVHVLGLGFRV